MRLAASCFVPPLALSASCCSHLALQYSFLCSRLSQTPASLHEVSGQRNFRRWFDRRAPTHHSPLPPSPSSPNLPRGTAASRSFDQMGATRLRPGVTPATCTALSERRIAATATTACVSLITIAPSRATASVRLEQHPLLGIDLAESQSPCPATPRPSALVASLAMVTASEKSVYGTY